MHRPVALIVLVAIAACGQDSRSRSDQGAGCPVHEHPGEPTPLAFRFQEASWAEGQIEAAVDRFNQSQSDVAVTATMGWDFLGAEIIDGAAPALVQVYLSEIAALAGAGAIMPLEPCLIAGGHDLGSYLPAALAGGRIDGLQWALPANVDSYLLLYDRNAFRAAGLDPDDPPRTLDELIAAARTLREQAGFAHPIALTEPMAVMATSGTDHAPAVVEALATLGREQLAHPEAYGGGSVSMLGRGEVAMEAGGLGFVWAMGHALADGQSPSADIGVAPMPGVAGPGAVSGGSYFALDADASPQEAAAAVRFLDWLEAPAQQAELHVISDRLPSRVAAVEEPAITTYWQELPLMAAAWEAFASAPVGLDGDGSTLSGAMAGNAVLLAVMSGELTEDEAVRAFDDALQTASAKQQAAPAEHLRCFVAALRESELDHEPPPWTVC